MPLLLTWLVLDRSPRRWYLPPLVGLLLAWVQVGDRIAMVVGVLPLIVACLAQVIRGVARREPLSRSWYELALAGAAFCSVAVASLAVSITGRLGGYAVRPLGINMASPASIPGNLRLTGNGVLLLYGIGPQPGLSTAQAAFALVHLAGLALAAVALGLAIWQFPRQDSIVLQVLTVAILANLALYALSSTAGPGYLNREIAAVLPLGAVLAGRLLAGRMLAAQPAPAGTSGQPSVALAAVLGGLLVCYAAALGYGVAQPSVPAEQQDLAGWLADHQLQTGLGGAESNIVTLDSRERTRVLVTTFGPTRARPDAYQSQASWYDPARHDANFVVSAGTPGEITYVPQQHLVADFGRPARTYHFRDYTIAVWDKNLLDDLR